MLKSMLLTLQSDLHRELQLYLSQVHDRIDCLEDRHDTVEEHMSEMGKAHKELFDAHDHHTDEIQRVKLKLADLKDRFRHNNKKFQRYPRVGTPQ